jgi:hypothetical protein
MEKRTFQGNRQTNYGASLPAFVPDEMATEPSPAGFFL